ncbi:MAG: hypothetical protein HYZ83_03880 [Candidatus Omnitrophica bacterium]|nr:hypothetical protein [Candidatus Omnitrophota bacterium]
MELENRQFYFERPIIRDAFLPWPPKDGEGDSTRLYQLLKERGVTHLLARDPVVPDAKIKNQFREILGDRLTVEMIKIPSENIRDEKYRYTLYALR